MSNEANKDWTWESSPKNEFNRRRLERCYSSPSSPPKWSYTTLGKSNIKQLPDDYDPLTEMTYKKRPHKEDPYWNFWKVVFAGWLIRYPIQILKGIGTVVVGLFLFGVLVYSSSESVEESSPIEYNNEVIQ